MRKTTSKMWAAAAGVTGIALLATACSGSSDTPSDEGSDGAAGENITLTLGTFNEPGYTDEMFKEYEDANPGITIENKKAATSNEARDSLNTRLASGSGASDVEMIEIDWLPELMQYPDKFVDLTDPALDGRWLDWKVAQATDARRRPHRLRHRHRPRGHLLPLRPVRGCRPADRPRGRRRAARWQGRHVGQVLRGRQAVPGRHGQAVLRRRRCHLPGHDQPGRERLRGATTARSSPPTTPR